MGFYEREKEALIKGKFLVEVNGSDGDQVKWGFVIDDIFLEEK